MCSNPCKLHCTWISGNTILTPEVLVNGNKATPVVERTGKVDNIRTTVCVLPFFYFVKIFLEIEYCQKWIPLEVQTLLKRFLAILSALWTTDNG